MNLEIKHIAPYLPYGLKINDSKNELIAVDVYDKTILSLFRGNLINIHKLGEFKPMLRPLSDLTKTIEHNGEKFVPSERLSVHLFSFDFLDYVLIKKEINGIPFWVSEKLFEWHFDMFRLIDNDLAISIYAVQQGEA